MLNQDSVRIDPAKMREASKPLFYGFIFLTGAALTVSPAYAGTLMGMAVIAAISHVSAALAESLDDDWSRFLELVSLLALMTVIFFASYSATRLSLLNL